MCDRNQSPAHHLQKVDTATATSHSGAGRASEAQLPGVFAIATPR